MFTNILMPTDGSEHSERAIERCIELANLCKARVTGIHVVPDYRLMLALAEGVYPDAIVREEAEKEAYGCAANFLAFVRETARAAGVPCETVVAASDRPYDAIVNAANERGCDLIVITARHRRGLWSLMMRSKSDRILHRASIPVLTFRALMSADHPDKAGPRWQDLSQKKVKDSSATGLL